MKTCTPFPRTCRHAGQTYKLLLWRRIPNRRNVAIYQSPLIYAGGKLSRQYLILDHQLQPYGQFAQMSEAFLELTRCQHRPRRRRPLVS